MKSFKLTGIRQMEVFDVPEPTAKDDQVVVELAAIGVCGSDVHYYVNGNIGSQVVEYPFAVGHECAGTVVKTGGSVSSLKEGDRVAVDPAMPCWKCDQCKAGRHHTCRNLKFLGCPGQAEGCLSEYIAMPETSCVKLPEGMSFTRGALSEPLAIGVYAVRLSIPMQDAKVAILGVGPIGLSVLLAAKAGGAETVFATDKLDYRLKAAKQAGADAAGNPDKQNIVKQAAVVEPGGFDVVFECCGQQDALDQAIEILKPGGKLMVVGIPQEDRVSFCPDKTRRKEICIQNVRRQVDCVDATLEMMADGRLNADFMATHRFGFDAAQEAFDLVSNYQDGVIKAMIDF
ncbi:Sorbitol dehydrogenase [Anaerohalosphaera lusitana]|uniref:Sorbitol dehydrogenase n=1 Tax=Anaerohalosphaera lusitana TaxID=1936003 RepID=A0A1U9NM42_9BACT|nr:alcohol dehydrogenase catalytic domain-containing protein [Anaerohalosphaera lusitana]AQT69001.1 Sorbitol dehydrogenase [Anaerohalosphaera lusitana]